MRSIGPIPTSCRTWVRRMIRHSPYWPEYCQLKGIESRGMRRRHVEDFLEYAMLFGDYDQAKKLAANIRRLCHSVRRRQWN